MAQGLVKRNMFARIVRHQVRYLQAWRCTHDETPGCSGTLNFHPLPARLQGSRQFRYQSWPDPQGKA